MKPFNLQEALAGKPVVTRSGLKVQAITHLNTAALYSVFAALVKQDGELDTFSVTTEGVYLQGDESTLDLFMVPEKREVVVNLWKGEDIPGYPFYFSTVHFSMAQAEAERTTSCSGKKKTLVERFQSIIEL